MLALLPIVAASAVIQAAPWGYELDCGSWPGGFRANLMIEVVAADGTTFVSGRITLGAGAKADVVQAILFVALEESGFEVQKIGQSKVTIFGPKGQAVRSVRFDADVWEPAKARVLPKGKP